jgi:hypothetical protein
LIFCEHVKHQNLLDVVPDQGIGTSCQYRRELRMLERGRLKGKALQKEQRKERREALLERSQAAGLRSLSHSSLQMWDVKPSRSKVWLWNNDLSSFRNECGPSLGNYIRNFTSHNSEHHWGPTGVQESLSADNDSVRKTAGDSICTPLVLQLFSIQKLPLGSREKTDSNPG